MKPSVKTALNVASLVLLFAIGLGVRRHVYTAQVKTVGESLPFTLESALSFRRVEQVVENGRLPDRDPDLEFPSGVVVNETDTVGDEYVYAALARIVPGRMDLQERVRWIEASWFCLGIPLMALWLWWWKRSRWGAAIAALFYAVAASSVIRSTGQEISHENFALPLLIGHLAFLSLATSSRRFWPAVVSAVLLAAALATWDMVQYYVLIRTIALMLLLAFGRTPTPGWCAWALQAVALGVMGAVHPYLRAHGFLLSPPVLLVVGMVAAAAVQRLAARGACRAAWGKPAAVLAIALLPVVTGWLVPNPYQDAYGHFGELLAAKIRFLNHKPADPATLTFDQRIMWVPALNSADWHLTVRWFPAILPLTLIAVLVFLRRSINQSDPEIIQLLSFGVVSFAAFGLFVRFHVFAAIFAAALLGLWAARQSARPVLLRVFVLMLLMAGVVVEAAQVLYKPAERWGRFVYYRELKELCSWLRRYASPEPVLANFGVSAAALEYGKCPILLHPKFESPGIRNRVREFGEHLFKGSEKSFRQWAEQQGAQYYIHGVGEFSTIAPELQMRYFVNAMDPSPRSAARLFESAPESMTEFQFLWGNRKYRVYKIRTARDASVVARLNREAAEALERGDLDRAEDRAVGVLMMRPDDVRAQDLLRHVGSLRDQGFGGSVHESR